MHHISFAISLLNLSSLEGSLTMVIPIVAIIMPFVFVITIVGMKFYTERKNRQLQHDTIRMALEKGQPLPAELLNMPACSEEKPKTNDRKSGLILIAVGVGLFFFLGGSGNFFGMHMGGGGLRWVALIPGLIGVALLINWMLERGEKKNEKN